MPVALYYKRFIFYLFIFFFFHASYAYYMPLTKYTIYFSGFLREISGTYTISLYAAAGAMLAGCALCFISLILHSRAKAKMRLEKAMAVFTVTRF